MDNSLLASKELLIKVLAELSILKNGQKALQNEFLEGSNPLTFESLRIDSMSLMEICIALEMQGGFSVSPDQLAELGTVLELAEFIEALDES